MNKVLITRSVEDNEALALKLAELGFISISCPTIAYDDITFDLGDIASKYPNIILTSKHATELVATQVGNIKNNICFWVVGKNSTDILNQAILKLNNLSIAFTAATAQGLFTKVLETIHNQAIYLSGDHINAEPPPAIFRQIIYHSLYKQALTSQELQNIQAGFKYVLLYSQNCAKTLLEICTNYNLLNILSHAIVIAISKQVANIVADYCQSVRYAENMNQDEMIKILLTYGKCNNNG